MSSNGLISFREGFNEFRVSRFPRISSCAVPLIAPLWADYNFRQGGKIYYRVTEDPATLAKAKEVITENNFSEFSPTLCVIVTWAEATLFTRTLDGDKVASYM